MNAPLRIFTAAALLAGATAAHAQGFAAPDSTGGALRFRTLGPTVAGGRVAAVAGIPGDPDTYWVGAASGGVWKTINGGNTWDEVFRDQPTASIGAVSLAPSNPNVVWVGTGEGNPRNDITNGHGVYVSPDAGRSWRFAGLPEAGQIPRIAVDPQDPDHALVAALGKVWVPNPDRGIFRTTDGGRTWKRVLYVNDTTGAVDVVFQPGNPRVAYAATWTMRRYPWEMVDGGTGSGIWRSTDGGETWTRLHGGLPEGIVGRIAVAMAPSSPSHMYAVIESREGTVWESTDAGDHWRRVSSSRAYSVRPWYFSQVNVDPTDENHVYFASFNLMESRDGGRTVRAVDPDVHPDHHALWIDPRNPRRIIQGNDGGVFVTSDQGKTWRFLNNLPIEQFYSVFLDPSTPYNVCGGLQDNNGWCGPASAPGGSSLSQSRWITVTGGDGQYVVPAPSDSTIIYVDSQNGFITRVDLKTGVTRSIRPYLQTVENTVPADLQYRFNWTSPIAVSPRDANEVYIGANVVFRSRDGGQTWQAISPDLTNNDKSKQRTSGGPINHDISGAETYNTILSVTLAPSDPENTIWVGTDDGNVQVTHDAGRTWTNVRPRGLLPEGRVYQVGVSPFDPNTAYITVNRHEFADMHPYVLRTGDGGRSWTRMDAGLPADQPAHVVRESPGRRGFLVLGTDNGLYWSRDTGLHWTRFDGFPHAPVWDVKFAERTHDIVVATHGRGILVLDDASALEQLTPEIERTAFEVFRPLPTVSFYGRQLTGVDPSLFSAPNAPRGAVINYWLAEKVQPRGAARAAINGPSNSVAAGNARNARGAQQGRPAAADTSSRRGMMAANGGESGDRPASGEGGDGPGNNAGASNRPVRIVVMDASGDTVTTAMAPGEQGMNRWVWNLRYSGPTQVSFEQQAAGEEGGGRRGGGPSALPGTYTVYVTANGVTRSTQVQVVPDPRLPWDTLAARQQFVLARRLTHQVTALNTMLNRIHSLRGQIANAQTAMREAGVRDSASAGRLRRIDAQLRMLSDSIYNPDVQRGVVQDDIHYLTDFQGMFQGLGFAGGGYNQAPTPLVMESVNRLSAQLDQFLARYNALVQNDIAAYNRDAAAHGSATLVPGGPVVVKP
ncbi:MAG: hypothetical protein JO306_15715 [Gemmatimonadetes bacterium]|nr:hypothetical protein [Gemmatimonadota bacterium]